MTTVSTPLKTLPLVRELTTVCHPADVFRRLSQRGHCLFLDSARRSSYLERNSFITADPFEVISLDPGKTGGLDRLADSMRRYQADTIPALPPFQGGAGGLWSYDLAQSLERVPAHSFDEFQLPGIEVGLYDVVVAFDHDLQKCWIVSQGFPEIEPSARRTRAEERVRQFISWLEVPPKQADWAQGLPIAPSELALSYHTNQTGVLSNFEAQEYRDVVQRAIDYIHAGDVFQVNLAQRLVHRATTDPVSLYLNLRARNPAPFAAYFDLGTHQIISASPERFLQVRNREVEARPIKGTRQRTARPEADLFSGVELQASSKDLAENVMIVDLMRNDLSRVCQDDSLRVTQLCELETYQYVQHLVSVIRGTLQDGATPVDLLRASFPGGSITGAPKIRAMEIIAELEPTARGPYCGSLGYIGFDGSMDLSILIRTITASGGWWQFPVGGGIVAQSDPHKEYLETWHKAAGMLHAIAACPDRP